MRIAIPAIPAKAAKRLPLMPHRSRRKLNRRNLPDVDGIAIKVPAPVNLEVNRVAVSRYLVNKIGKMPWILLISPRPNKRPAQGRPFGFSKARVPPKVNTSRPPGRPS
jgi:hypothetical protein